MSTDKRLAQQFEHFERAFARLDEVLNLPDSPIVRDAAIKRFEFTFEMAWKCMYRWLRFKEVNIPEEAFEVIPRAFKAGLIDDDASWTRIRRARNMTAHTYDEKKAIEVATAVRNEAAPRFRELLERLRTGFADK
jgi:nucleotidyltransferase substrate binding protein (TIGR01987 family)